MHEQRPTELGRVDHRFEPLVFRVEAAHEPDLDQLRAEFGFVANDIQ
jgi:hypothetical protein